jgi:penicillin-binding protein 1A
VVYRARPETAGSDAERVLDERNAFLMTTLMRDVVRYGTAAKAMSLGRNDPRRKDRHHQRPHRRVVRGIQREARRGFVDRVRHAGNLGPNETGGQRRCRSGWDTRARC